MRLQHFHQLRPLCLACRAVDPTRESGLTISHVVRQENNDLLEGLLRCGDPDCQYEYPVIDGIPYLLTSLPEFLAANAEMIQARTDLSPLIKGVIADCTGPESSFNITRQHLSSYGWCHYEDLNPDNCDDTAGSTSRLLTELPCPVDGAKIANGPVVDLGCAVGRTTFELAVETNQLVLGIDLNVAMLRTASAVLREGRIRYPLRRVGVVYDEQDFPHQFEQSDNVDFWACDVTNLPFSDATFSACVSLNTLDSVASPLGLLHSIARVLEPHSAARIACPYDWTASVTQMQGWIGGHSQRADHGGRSESVLQQILSNRTELSQHLEIVQECQDIPWTVRVHDRSRMVYRLHGVVLQRADNGAF